MMKRTVLCTLAFFLPLAACSSKDDGQNTNSGSAEAKARSALLSTMKQARKDATDTQAECFADAVIKSVGAEEALSFAASADDPEVEVSAKTEDAATAAFVSCFKE